MTVAGISTTDYTIVKPSEAVADDHPSTTADEIAIVPKGLAGTKKGPKCYVKYTHKADDDKSPDITIDTSEC